MPGSGSERAANSVRSPEQSALQRLDGVRFRLRDDLTFASTTEEQANLAERLAMAYGRAADQLRSPELVSAAQSASAAYASLESAARAGDQDAYDVARGDVEASFVSSLSHPPPLTCPNVPLEVSVGLQAVTRTGNTVDILTALRDHLAGLLEVAEPKDASALARQLRDTLAALDKIPNRRRGDG